MRQPSSLGFLVASLAFALGAPAQSARLQILNASRDELAVFARSTADARTPRGRIAPGAETILDAAIGDRFELQGRDGKVAATIVSAVRVQGYRFDPNARDGVPSFYAQRTDAHGFPIVASAKVSPFALAEAAFLLDQMLAHRPDVRAAMIASGARLCVMAPDEFTTDLPEFAHLGDAPVPGFDGIAAKDWWDARARGLGGSETDPFCSCAEENLLGYPGDPYAAECILIHEFAHAIHLRGMQNVDPTFDVRLQAAYDAAMRAGLWQGKYAATNSREYFAEGVQSWFDDNRVNDHDHNHVHTRVQLREYDPGLAAMCREVFGDTELHYTKPARRCTGHLAGYDPSKAPTFAWPERLQRAHAAIRAQAEARDRGANGSLPRETRTIRGFAVHIRRELLQDDTKTATERALALLQQQLAEIERLVPAKALAELQKVPLWISPEYPRVRPTAEYHPGADWLREHGRDPAMAKGVEFTNVREFEQDCRRMPVFVLHELSHAYHDRVLPNGFGNQAIRAAYDRAKASGSYDRVDRRDSDGRVSQDRAYAMTDPQEYFAESSEAFFAQNDFFPWTRAELRQHDPQMCALLAQLWGAPDDAPPAKK